MAAVRFPPEETRSLLRSALPTVTASGASDRVEPRFHYVPERHARALSRDVAIVRGIRGAGKTLWWSALQGEDDRQRVAQRIASLGFLTRAKVITGFGAGGGTAYPSGRTVSHLLEQGHEAEDIWRAILLWGAAAPEALPHHDADWSMRVAWVAREVETSERLLHRVNDELDAEGRDLLVLFDALDRAGRTWRHVRKMLRGLFQLMVELRELERIRGKAFIRPEMLDHRDITSFQDASKLLNDAVDLEWRPSDLYGLLWQYLGNADEGTVFRDGCAKRFGVVWKRAGDVWVVPDRMRRDAELQERILTAIAGKYMGSDHRRGKVYTWLPNHLGDSLRQVSPRSFLVALRKAAEVVSASAATALDYHAIKEGVADASNVRRREVEEDQPWVADALTPLEDLLVPAPEKQVVAAWKKAGLIEALEARSSDDGPSVPRRIDEGIPGILRELEEIGVLGRSPDARIQMPDVYRIAFRLKRRGGVPPVRR
jgi:hypothetical protein